MQNKYVALAMMGALVLGASQAKAEGKDGVAAVVNGEKNYCCRNQTGL